MSLISTQFLNFYNTSNKNDLTLYAIGGFGILYLITYLSCSYIRGGTNKFFHTFYAKILSLVKRMWGKTE